MIARLAGTALAAALAVLTSVSPAFAYPAADGYVVDAAGMISDATEAQLEQELADYEQRTTDEVAVTVVANLEGQSIDAYANGLFNAWGIGQAERNNGALLVIAMAERGVRIEVGDGLRDRLTDAVAQSIVDAEVTPRLRSGDIDGAVNAGAIGIRRALDDDVRQPDATATAPVLRYSDDPTPYRDGPYAAHPWADDGKDPGQMFGTALGLMVVIMVVAAAVRMMAGGNAFGDWDGDDEPGHHGVHHRHTSSFFSPPRRSSSWGSSDSTSSSSDSSSDSSSASDSFGGGRSSGGGASGSW